MSTPTVSFGNSLHCITSRIINNKKYVYSLNFTFSDIILWKDKGGLQTIYVTEIYRSKQSSRWQGYFMILLVPS